MKTPHRCNMSLYEPPSCKSWRFADKRYWFKVRYDTMNFKPIKFIDETFWQKV